MLPTQQAMLYKVQCFYQLSTFISFFLHSPLSTVIPVNLISFYDSCILNKCQNVIGDNENFFSVTKGICLLLPGNCHFMQSYYFESRKYSMEIHNELYQLNCR